MSFRRPGPEADVKVHLAHDVSAPTFARRAMAPISGSGAFFDDVQMVTTELVANVVRHTKSGGTLRAWEGDPLRLEVYDTSSVLPLLEPARRVGGLGLWIVDTLCSRWGSTLESTGKVVWAEFDQDSDDKFRSDAAFFDLVSQFRRRPCEFDVEQRQAALYEREQRVAATEAAVTARVAAVTARVEEVRGLLSAAELRDAIADARDAVADARERAASFASFIETGDEFIAALKARRAAATDRAESKNDREMSADDRAKLTNEDS